MDPLSHVICSRSLLALGGNRSLGRDMTTAAIVGALAPDSDAVFIPAGWDVYLRIHEVGTHSLIGSLVTACVVTIVIRALAPATRWRNVAVAAAIGTMSHLALDALSGARLRLLWPLSDAPTTVPLVAMADPWLVAIFLLGAIATVVLHRRVRLVSVAVIAVASAFLLFKAAGLASATSAWRNGPGRARITTSLVQSRWGSLTEWAVFDRTPDLLRMWRIDAGGQAPTLLVAWPVPADPPLVARSRLLHAVQNFLHVHELAFAVESANVSGGTRVMWSDLRFCHPADRNGISCDVWVGGQFGGDGTPVMQVVEVGWLHQTRGLAR
jgi:membrane-bound metal-dependent hydrolase YbcI (DUF457 family)